MKRRTITSTRVLKVAWIPLCLTLMACHMDMYYQPKATTYDTNSVFANKRQAQDLPVGVVRRGTNLDEGFNTGAVSGTPVAQNPLTVDADVLERGRDRYEVFCTPCHGTLANGAGVVSGPLVSQGSGAAPASMYLQRLRDEPDGYYFEVITNGVVRNGGQYMYPYASRIAPEDRWAIIAYIRELQQNPPSSLTEAQLNPTEAPQPDPARPTPIPFNTPTAQP